MNSAFLKSINWQTQKKGQEILSQKVQSMLFCSGSLTAILKEQGVLTVQVLHESMQDARDIFDREKALLPEDECFWVREVLLSVNQKNAVFARSVIPQKICNTLEVLTKMGQQPLGEFLFSHHIKRGDFEWSATSNGLARHSLFYIAESALLVGECFLNEYWDSYYKA
ncbi:chorismate--pyruvate lyase family protein [Basilea psittacipulmonis]|uniref:chorismate--pyruvate lyase family protein n=1 Tax=Basilea psittacipulmonis TaxID=1472345 RepID=UPI00068A3B2A|nr:chorismate lyase [Basilea psittacipulmonis]